jgi:RimJ/RimL family protein N-acetyltransferase
MPYPEAVETERLTLRRWTLDDGAAMDAIWRERDVWSALRPDIPFDPGEDFRVYALSRSAWRSSSSRGASDQRTSSR